MNPARVIKPIISLTIDLSIAIFCSILALWIRLGGQMDVYEDSFYLRQALLLAAACLISNIMLKVYQGTWRYFNFSYFIKLNKYALLSSVLFSLFIFIDEEVVGYPRSAIIINIFIIASATAFPRWLYRFLSDRSYITLFASSSLPAINVLIIGLNKSSEAFLKELTNLKEMNYKVVGILDDKNFIGRSVNDIQVLGDPKDLKKIVSTLKKQNLQPQRILISPEFYVGGKLKDILKLAESLSIPISSFPKLSDLNNNFGIRPIKSIPLEDLLQRPQREHNHENIRNLISGNKILVTGAGGSIGSEIARQVASNNPSELAILDNSEYLLYEIEQEIKQAFPDLKLTLLLTDIRDTKTLDTNISLFKPDTVFHAAALKHVPMIESNRNEAIKTNIIGTNNLIKSSIKAKVNKFIMISTDKAVNPSSFMGASKRIAETLCYLNANNKMQISVVRFGNVLGSNGSVVPIFERQISKGGPITVTHKDATRYFMTIKEAVFLVMQSSIAQKNNFEVYVLDMGKPISIYELAKNMIHIAGLIPHKDIDIKVTGLRPGEKIHEELYYNHEELLPTDHLSISKLSSDTFSDEYSNSFYSKLEKAVNDNQIDKMLDITTKIIIKSAN